PANPRSAAHGCDIAARMNAPFEVWEVHPGRGADGVPTPDAVVGVQQLEASAPRIALKLELDETRVTNFVEYASTGILAFGVLERLDIGAVTAEIDRVLPDALGNERSDDLTI